MKKNVKKMTLSKETVLSLVETREANGGATIPCYPPSYGPSCYAFCPVNQSRDNCA
jgi:hypothetical protein